ncbi:hypothetical protein GQ457_04G007550 [Hibiscus cannabinus]
MWLIWQKWCSLWDVYLIFPVSIKDLIKVWVQSTPPKLQEYVWMINLFSFMWSCWLFRNKIVFDGKRVNKTQLFDICTSRLTRWCNENWPDSGTAVNFEDNMNFPKSGELKFNIDGAVNGSFGEAGICGCLRNENSRCLVTFSKNVGNADPTTAEIMATLEAVSIFRKSRWVSISKLLFETDSILIVEWIMNLHTCPFVFKQLITLCLERCKAFE